MSAKSKSQTTSKPKASKFVCCAPCKAEVILTDSDLRDTRWRCPECLRLNPLPKHLSVAPATELVIQRNSLHHCWQVVMALGSHSNWLLPLSINKDEIEVATWLQQHVNGPVNVIVNV